MFAGRSVENEAKPMRTSGVRPRFEPGNLRHVFLLHQTAWCVESIITKPLLFPVRCRTMHYLNGLSE